MLHSYRTKQSPMSHFPKSVTQSRLEQHDNEFENITAQLAESKQVGRQSIAAVYESMGELRFEVEALEGRERDTRLLAERNREGVEGQAETVEGLGKAYDSLSQVLNEELERIREEHGTQITTIAHSVKNHQNSLASQNARFNDVATDQQALRSRVEDDLERMKGQIRQQRIEVDDVRRQAGVTGDLQQAMAELNGNQKELAAAVGGLQQSSIYISEWVQALRAEASELRAIVSKVQAEQARSSRALAGDVAVLAEDVAGLRTKMGHQDAELERMRGDLKTKIEDVAVNVNRSVDAQRGEVQAVLTSVKGAMKRQSEQQSSLITSLHNGQQRLSSQITDNLQTTGSKIRFLEQLVAKLESGVALKTGEMSRALEDHVSSIKRHLDANDQSVRMVTDFVGGALANGRVNVGTKAGGDDRVSPERGSLKTGGLDFP